MRGEREIKRQVKARQASLAKYNAQYSRASASNRREKWDVIARGSQERVVVFCLVGTALKQL
jgi:hypothetical protein